MENWDFSVLTGASLMPPTENKRYSYFLWCINFFMTGASLVLTLNAPIATKVVCFSRLLKCLRSLYGKQCGSRSDLFWVHNVCFYTYFVSNVQQLFAADDFSRRHFQMHFFLGALRVKEPSNTISMSNSFDHLLVRLGSERLSVKLACKGSIHDLSKWTLGDVRLLHLCIRKNLLDYLPIQNPCIV